MFSKLLAISKKFQKLAADKLYYIADSEIDAEGVFANTDIPSGTTIEENVTKIYPLTIITMGSKINHQFNCNARLSGEASDDILGDEEYDLVAIKNIAKGEEITINYKDTPWFIDKNTEGFKEL